MEIDKKFVEIFDAVLVTKANHTKYEQMLKKIYENTDLNTFLQECMLAIHQSFIQTIGNKQVETFLNFMGKFVANIARNHELQMDANATELDDQESHPLLKQIIANVMKYTNLNKLEARYYSCYFLQQLLESVGNDIQLDEDICDQIQEHIILRMTDTNWQIRKQALCVLVRLQDPYGTDCPIVEAFVENLVDPHAAVRKEAVKNIGINHMTLQKLMDRLRDIDPTVRAAAFLRFSKIGPTYLSLQDRQHLLSAGFLEEEKVAKHVFIEKIIPAWLAVYNGNLIDLLKAIKLDADENDIKKSTSLMEQLLEEVVKQLPITELIETLHLNDEKLISVENLASEHVIFWNALCKYFHSSNDMEEYLDVILPELTQFCNYMEKYINLKEQRLSQEWMKVEFYQTVFYLLKIASQFDFSEEAGRQSMLKFIRDSLVKRTLEEKITLEMIKIYNQILADTNTVCTDISNLILQIREKVTTTVKPAAKTITMKDHFQKVKLNVAQQTLRVEQDQALNEKDYQKAAEIEGKLKEIKEILQSFEENTDDIDEEEVKELSNDPTTICQCLDILYGLLSLPNLKSIPDSLKMLKLDLIDPNAQPSESEVYYRSFKCLCLYTLISREIAEEHLIYIVTPIITYKIMPRCIKTVLMSSIKCIVDLLKLYGPEIFQECNDITASRNNNRRKLYQSSDISLEDGLVFSLDRVIDCLLDMLDSEVDEIRELSGNALSHLIINKIVISPSLLSRLLVKWFNPLTEKHDPKLCQLFGHAFLQLSLQSDDILQNAVLPTIDTVANAPKKSPLVDINMDKMIRVLASLTSFSASHKQLAFVICSKITSQPDGIRIYLYSKLLQFLSISPDDVKAIQELQEYVDKLLNVVQDKNILKNLQRFQTKLKQTLEQTTLFEETNTITSIQNEETTTTIQNNDTVSSNHDKNEDSSSEKSVNIRKRIKLNSREPNENEQTNKSSHEENGKQVVHKKRGRKPKGSSEVLQPTKKFKEV